MVKEKFLGLIEKYSDDLNYNLDCWTEMERNYSSKSRFYHTLAHIENMVTELEEVADLVKNWDGLLFSIFYHDIIYNATKTDNEHQSALLFEKRISKTSFRHINPCKAQIEATKEHQHADDADTNILLDIDLAILGKNKNRYQEYAQNIRKEYQIYPDFLYRKGRKKVLKTMLEKEAIYQTQYFREQYENQARANILSELNQLSL